LKKAKNIMTFENLIHELAECSVKLRRNGDRLQCRTTQGALSQHLQKELRNHKQAIFEWIGRETGNWLTPRTSISPELLPLVDLTQTQIDRIVETVPGGAANIQDIYPLAPLQEGMLFHHLLEQKGDVYLESSVMAFDTKARLDNFINALQAVIERHDVLRTAVLWEGLSEPVQVVWRRAPLQMEEVTLSSADPAHELRDHIDPRKQRIDIRQAPLVRFYIAEDEANGSWLLGILSHHLAVDHSSLEFILEEIQAHLLGEAHRLPAPVPFRNFVVQARLGVSRKAHETFFRQMLGTVDAPTAPFGLLDVQGDGSGIAEAVLQLDNDFSGRLRNLARAARVSVASLCHLAWAQVLGRLAGREDVVFGTVLFGRMQGGESTDRGLGLFMNTLPVRIVVGDDTVEQAVKKTHALLAQLLHHEHASLVLAQRCSSVPFSMPLFTTLLNYRYTQQVATQTAWEGMEVLHGEERTNYPLTLSVNDFGTGLGLTAHARESIDPKRICAYMHTALAHLADALEQATKHAVRFIEVIPESERQRILHDWNKTETEYPKDKCMHQLFEEQVQKTPEAVAVVYEDKNLTYRELNEQANRLAHHLIGLGIGPDSRVAIGVERSLEMVVGLLAILKAGGAYVPLDPAYPMERLEYMLEDSSPLALLTQSSLRGQFGSIPEKTAVIELDGDGELWSDLDAENIKASQQGLTPHHLAYVIYTSGSTGKPKGVMIEHHALTNFLWTMRREPGLTADDVLIAVTTLCFDIAGLEVWLPLLVGARCVVASRSCAADGMQLTSLIERSGATILQATPSTWRLLLAAGWQGRPNFKVLCGGEALARDLAESLVKGTGKLWNVYGPTEATIWSNIQFLTPPVGPITIGHPIANTQMYILDRHLQPVPMGVAGELYIGGIQLARGYLNRPELTAERFMANPFVKATPEAASPRIYKTGDLGRWLPDGTIEFLGRNDFQVKIRGFRIELGEIESKLAALDGVKEAVVLAREDETGDNRLIAYYTGSDELTAETLRTQLSRELPDYMVPAAYVRLEALPLTPNGKLDRKALPAPEGDAYSTRAYEAPRGEIEEALAHIWAEILKVERIGRHDNFFDLGGHSLLAVQMASRIQQEFSVFVEIQIIFSHSTIALLAEYVVDLQLSQFDQEELAKLLGNFKGEKNAIAF